jgi:hypothetical protein
MPRGDVIMIIPTAKIDTTDAISVNHRALINFKNFPPLFCGSASTKGIISVQALQHSPLSHVGLHRNQKPLI